MGMKSGGASAAPSLVSQVQYTPKPYYGDGRNEREVQLRGHGYGGSLDDANAINDFLTKNYGSPDVVLNSSIAPAPGTQARIDYDAQQAAGATNSRKAQNIDLARSEGYYGPTGDGQMDDYILRNFINDPVRLNNYVARRNGWEPTYNANYLQGRTSAATQAYNNAKALSAQELQRRNLSSDSDVMSQIDRALEQTYKAVPYGTKDASSYFSPDAFESLLSGIQTDRRNQYGTTLDSLLPSSYADDTFNTTFDDDIISRFLDSQYGGALTQLDNNKKRGVLTDQGYNSALNVLGTQRSTANSKLQSTGENLLATNRGALNDIISSGKKAASEYVLGGAAFDPNKYKTDAEARAAELKGRFSDDFNAAVGGENFFDVPSALNSGYSAQGPQNTTRQGVLDALAQKENARNQRRGVGSQGAF